MALQIVKSGQGRYVRIGTAIGVGLVNLVICYYVWLMLNRHIAVGFAAKMYLEYGIPIALFAVMAAVAFIYLNKPGVVDFFIATESEMKKVSWSGKPELIGSTIVVIGTVLMLADLIFIGDFFMTSMLSGGVNLSFRAGVWTPLALLLRLFVMAHLAAIGVALGYTAAFAVSRAAKTSASALGGPMAMAAAVGLLAWYVSIGINIPGLRLW